MATTWSRNKVDSATINSGNEYEKGSRVSRQNLNAMVNSGLYAQDFAEKLVTNIDTSEIGSVGTPNVTIIDGDGATSSKPYKKFKFSNLKGDKGETGNGIVNVSKSSTSGLIDTYKITFTNGSTSSFQVSNGDSVDMRVSGGYFQWKRTQDTNWNNLIATSEIATVDQTLSNTSTNAIANKAVKEEFNKVVYNNNFDNNNATKFGNYIVEKKKLLWKNINGQSSEHPYLTDVTLNESVAIGDILEVEMSFGLGRIFHRFEVLNVSGNLSAQLCQPQLWQSDETESATRQVRNNYCSIYLKSPNELRFSFRSGTWYTFTGASSSTASFTYSGGAATLFKVYKIIFEDISSSGTDF